MVTKSFIRWWPPYHNTTLLVQGSIKFNKFSSQIFGDKFLLIDVNIIINKCFHEYINHTN